MNNLFVCNSQAQLILACGLALGRFKEDVNDLILFRDFDLKEEMKERLDGVFNKTLYLQSIYPRKFNTFKSKLKWYPKDLQEIKSFINHSYNRMFVVCDWVFLVQKAMQCAYRYNNSTEFCWLEDGITAYYSDSDIRGGFDSNKFTRLIRRIIVQYVLGVGKFYQRDFREMGGLSILKRAFVTYPQSAREPYRSRRELVEISDTEYRLGLRSLYQPSQVDIPAGSVILVVDKLDRYQYPQRTEQALSQYIQQCYSKGQKVFCKFHPRETDSWPCFEVCETMDRSVGIESLYLSLLDKSEAITVAGIKSTGLMSAKKLGFHAYSLFPATGETNGNLERFYQSIGIPLVNKL